MIIQLFQFILFFAMSAVANVQVVLQDVRQANIENVKRAICFGLRLDDDEKHLIDQIFNINISKMMSSNKAEIDTLNDPQLHFMQSQLFLKIAQKIKLMMSSLEDYINHDLLVEANFHYDQPQQMVYDQIQQYLNLMATSDAVEQITNP